MADDALEISQAPEPTDIIWENLGTKWQEQMKYRFYTYMATLLLLGLSLLAGSYLTFMSVNNFSYNFGLLFIEKL